MIEFLVRDLGTLSYEDGLTKQLEAMEAILEGQGENVLLLVEHLPVVTLGANFKPENLLFSKEFYLEKGFEITTAGRGGDVTLHNPGQLVAYPIFSLEGQGNDLHKWLRQLEETVLLCLAELRMSARRFEPHTGVWIENRKVCAIGVKVRKWVSMHGLALNCSNDLSDFEWIVPCGIRDYRVTSISQELHRTVTPEEVKPLLVSGFRAVFS